MVNNIVSLSHSLSLFSPSSNPSRFLAHFVPIVRPRLAQDNKPLFFDFYSRCWYFLGFSSRKSAKMALEGQIAIVTGASRGKCPSIFNPFFCANSLAYNIEVVLWTSYFTMGSFIDISWVRYFILQPCRHRSGYRAAVGRSRGHRLHHRTATRAGGWKPNRGAAEAGGGRARWDHWAWLGLQF